jgi:GNAT superfamily N-acetyltransferase
VVLPAPLGPSRPSTLPVRAAKSTPHSALTEPYDFCRPSTTMASSLTVGTVVRRLRAHGTAGHTPQIQAHLSALLVGEGWRRRGLARALLREALSQAGGLRMDIICPAGNFYLHLGARALSGFRLERRELGLEGPA